jgi:hypothetical protein
MPRRSFFLLLAAGVLWVPGHGVQAQQAGDDPLATVRALSLDRQLFLRVAQGDLQNATLLDPLFRGSVVQTGDNSRAAIQFTDDASVIRINPGTFLEVTSEGERGAITKTIDIREGEFWAEVNRREGSEFRIRSSTAVAAVRGTEFLVRVDQNGRMTIITLDGLLEFFTDVGTIQIPAGSKGSAGSPTEVPVLEQTSPDDLVAFQALIRGDGLASQSEWQTIEIPLVDSTGRVRTFEIQVPRGTNPTGAGGNP